MTGIGFSADFERYIAQLVAQNSPEVVNARLAQNLYPDVALFRDADGGYRYFSHLVNYDLNQAFVMYDKEGRVWLLPYLEYAGLVIHGAPHSICLGRRVEQGFGVTPEPGWDDIVEQFPSEIKKLAVNFLDAHPPIVW